MNTRAVVYLRLSQSDDASTSIARQRADLLALAEREGYAVVAEFADDGISGRKTRANATEALRMIRDREADALLVWKLDRWSRQGLGALSELITVLDEVPEALFIALQDGLRSSQPAWRIIAGVLAEVARMEAENTSARVRSSQAHLLKNGRFRGYLVPYGYRSVANPDGPGRVLVIDEDEAPIIREVAARAAAGETLTELTRYLRAVRLPTGRSPARKARQAGQPWEHLDRGLWKLTTLRVLLTNQTLLGRTTHEVDGVRVPVTDEHGLPVTFWEPVIEPSMQALLRERFPTRTGSKGPRRAARVLSGVAFCAECDSKAYVIHSGGGIFYKCPSRSLEMEATCPAPRIRHDVLEDYVEEVLLSVMGDAPELEEVRVVDNPEAESALADIDGALHDATAALMSDGADASALMERIVALKARRRELRDRPASVHVMHVPTGRTIRDAWEAADPSTPEGVRVRRELVLHAIDHVRIRSTTQGARWLPASERVDIMWNPERDAVGATPGGRRAGRREDSTRAGA